MVSQSRRYWRNARRRCAARSPGSAGSASSRAAFFKAPHFGGFREQMALPAARVDMAIHQFDLARDLIGSEPVSVFCESFNPGWSWYAGRRGRRGDLRVRRRHPVRLQRQLVQSRPGDVVERQLADQRS